MDARRVTRASASRPPATATKSGQQLADDGAARYPHLHPTVSVEWPEGGALTLDWVHALGRALDFASRNLQPAELPTVLPVSVCEALLLIAHKVIELVLPLSVASAYAHSLSSWTKVYVHPFRDFTKLFESVTECVLVSLLTCLKPGQCSSTMAGSAATCIGWGEG
jgi:hypothetical protein